jgi:dephospho-CoA kinase
VYGFDFESIFIESGIENREKRYSVKCGSNDFKDIIKAITEKKNIKLLKNKATKVIKNDLTIVDFQNRIKELIRS